MNKVTLVKTGVGLQSTKEGDIPNILDETRVGVQGNFGETRVGVQAVEDSHIPNAVDETVVGVQSAEEGDITNALHEEGVGYLPTAIDETLGGEHPSEVEVEPRQEFDPFGDFNPF
ncbi:hypothetical protein L6452_24796 [Arctium lappa]|uniref:Uncharacterized protein n=1 Tax=Arctium lappa TaxID=4217 RepID=A0ACB9A9D0_ARCLA|nr:hypothetical protein L6452_24796 [Arctium lappa]